jgi:hypothetical protein
VVVIFLPGLRERDQLRRHRARAVRQRICDRGEDSVARQADGHLLIRSEPAEREARIRDAADDESAVVALGKRDPFSVMRTLVAQAERRLERLIVIDAEHSAGKRRALRDQASRFRRIVARASVPEGPVGLETVEIRGADAPGDAVELRIVPRDGERDRRVEQRAEVVGVMRVFPEIVGVNQQDFADGLLESGVELVAEAGLNRYGSGSEEVTGEAADAGGV